MSKNLMEDLNWTEYYSPEQLRIIEEYMNKANSNVVIFKCECCNEYTAALSDNYTVVLPYNWKSREECMNWCAENGYPIVGEIMDGQRLDLN